MGIACHSQAFSVGSSVPWAEPGYGVIATQSIAEPFSGELSSDEPDLLMRSAVVHALAGDTEEATTQMAELDERSPPMVEVVRRFLEAGLIPDLGPVVPPRGG
jgi:uncharacterized Ntn-hydrolase superfamily protein